MRSCSGLPHRASWEKLLSLYMTQFPSCCVMICRGQDIQEFLACRVLLLICIPCPGSSLLYPQMGLSPEMPVSAKARNLEDTFYTLTLYLNIFDSKEFLLIPHQAPSVQETSPLRAFVWDDLMSPSWSLLETWIVGESTLSLVWPHAYNYYTNDRMLDSYCHFDMF